LPVYISVIWVEKVVSKNKQISKKWRLQGIKCNGIDINILVQNSSEETKFKIRIFLKNQNSQIKIQKSKFKNQNFHHESKTFSVHTRPVCFVGITFYPSFIWVEKVVSKNKQISRKGRLQGITGY